MKAGFAAIIASALALSACTQMGGGPAGGAPAAGGRYVAMGSSMAAGPGLGEIKPGTPARCTRTFLNYPTLLAEELKLTLYDATCSGATTSHILEPWDDLPPQIEAVSPETKLVTVTIGGNDLNYVGGLIAAGCGEDDTLKMAGRTFACPPRREPSEVDFSVLESNLEKIADDVKQRAPGARLVFVEYLRLVPDTLCDATPIAEEDAAKARDIAQRLADITAKVARENGALLVPVHRLSAEHTPCSAKPWALGNPPEFDGKDGVPWHPNYAGMAAVANMVGSMLVR